MKKIGITGQAGFMGTHLYNTICLYPERFSRVTFKDSYFKEDRLLESFISQCDVVVHLAAMNRHDNQDVIYNTNIRLVKQIIAACESTGSTPHIIFSSSTQEERNNQYGKSKKEGRRLFEKWAESNKARFTGLIMPNVYGPFGLPYYNSVVATFCHQLTHNELPVIEVDGELKLIYIGELIKNILTIIEKEEAQSKILIRQIKVKHSSEVRVSTILETLNAFKTIYLENGEIPSLDTFFSRSLFNTFLCYIDHSLFFPFKLLKNTDNRGSFIETIKLNSGGQVSFSTTVPGITRGNHFHTRKAERFAVIKGKARIDIRRIGTDKIISFELNGDNPSFVDMPVWYTHNITNTGDEDLYTIFWINEKYDKTDPDTFFEKV